MLRSRLIAVACLALFAATALAQDAPSRNILWDGGFDTGYGNAFWGTEMGGIGPNRRDMWDDGVLTLKQPVCSRSYWLEKGTYTLCAWVKRSAASSAKNPRIFLTLTNRANVEEKKENTFTKPFSVPVGEGWQRVGFTFDITSPHRPLFHVEIKGDGTLLLDAVSLTAGPQMPDKPTPAGDIEAAFFIADETGIYVDGEERVVELVIRNHGSQVDAAVNWEMYDHREQLVRKGVVRESLPARATVRKRLPVADLPWDGYRLACSVEGQKVLGDALVVFLPKIDQDAFIQYGVDGNVTPEATPFMGRWLKKMGMKRSSTLSPGRVISRWEEVEPQEGKYVWQDATVDAILKENVELVVTTGMKMPPAWLNQAARKEGRELVIYDEERFTKAYCRWIDALVRHYAGRINIYILEDEVHTMFNTPETLAQCVRVYQAAYDTAKKAAKDMGADITVSINARWTDWWEKFIKAGGTAKLDFISQNTNQRPQWIADTFNMLRANKWYPPYHYSLGVGQRSEPRKISFMSSGSGSPMGLFAYQLMMASWLSRPYGVEDVTAGPLVRYTYYDGRVLGQYIASPSFGKTCIEYDNSPTLGGQAMAMLKYHLSGMRALRDAKMEFSLKGRPTRHGQLFAYPFTDGKKAAIVLMTEDGRDTNARWKFTGAEFAAFKPFDIYGKPLHVEGNTVTAVELPVFVSVAADKVNAALKACAAAGVEQIKPDNSCHVEVGKYILDVDPDRPGLLRLAAKKDGKELVIIDKLLVTPTAPYPTVQASGNKQNSSVQIVYIKGLILNISLSENGVTIRWHNRNTTDKPFGQTVAFRVSLDGAGRQITIREGDKTVTGFLREDYGAIQNQATKDSAPLPKNASSVNIDGFATFELPAAEGKDFSPPTGFLWRQRGGEALLESAHTIHAGNPSAGSRGATFRNTEMTIVVP